MARLGREGVKSQLSPGTLFERSFRRPMREGTGSSTVRTIGTIGRRMGPAMSQQARMVIEEATLRRDSPATRTISRARARMA